MVGREAVLRAKGAPGGCSLAVGGDVSPVAAPAAKSTWPPRHLEGVDLVAASEKSESSLAKAADGRLSEHCGHHRRGGAVLVGLEPGPNLGPS